MVEKDGFLINYDGQRFCYKFKHRMAFETIRNIHTNNGYVKVGYVSFNISFTLGAKHNHYKINHTSMVLKYYSGNYVYMLDVKIVEVVASS